MTELEGVVASLRISALRFMSEFLGCLTTYINLLPRMSYHHTHTEAATASFIYSSSSSSSNLSVGPSRRRRNERCGIARYNFSRFPPAFGHRTKCNRRLRKSLVISAFILHRKTEDRKARERQRRGSAIRTEKQSLIRARLFFLAACLSIIRYHLLLLRKTRLNESQKRRFLSHVGCVRAEGKHEAIMVPTQCQFEVDMYN